MIKKIAFTFAIGIAFMSAQAQDKTDVLRYSELNPGGSSRAQAIGGATGSIGGDYSSIFSNPAGVGFFKSSELAFSLDFQQANNKSTYLNTNGSDNKGNFNIGSVGLILASPRRNPNSKWQNITLGLGYSRQANFNQNIYYRGRNNTSSIGSQYVSNLNGVDTASVYDGAYAFGPLEAVKTGFLSGNFDNAGNPLHTWTTISPYDDPAGAGVLQENSIYTSGRSEIYSLALGTNYADKFYIGGSLNMPHIEYERNSVFRETNDQHYQYLGYTMNYYESSTYLNTTGNGFQANLGVIYRPIPALRVGATFISPMWLSMHDSYYGNYTTSDNTGTYTASTLDEDEYNAPVESHYNIRTPWRGIVSAAYVFTPKDNNIRKPSGFLTVDYEYEDYASSSLKFKNGLSDDNQSSNLVQSDIKSSYQSASNIRAGGEIKIDIWAFRAGFAYYGNPYATGGLDGSRKFYSGGLGYRNKGFYADLTYVYMNQNLLDQPYAVGSDQPNTPTPAPASIKANTSNVSLGIGFKF
ncbi:hypothetical protein GA0116948_109161 [Chitinophaga costaii]|uniref:Outer membrane protein transport protein (OMPP1/FadL/TodX) n=1 Tax=Chitinophaga costaii TaxID=1335309 RepID=A0A1C4ESK0_9BACT|nr:hypothetical protein [Chitinophaga costaii]PUZ22562.1 hypothetical protein DCM91_14945 [Chitinophaga costaii]SCC46506.1 hypothetical protein GA0116948_109161 [Chitinophaga costaii]